MNEVKGSEEWSSPGGLFPGCEFQPLEFSQIKFLSDSLQFITASLGLFTVRRREELLTEFGVGPFELVDGLLEFSEALVW